MAARVARVFEDGGVLLAEAGTGTGKTLAYLVPAILSRQRVLVSTGTKNLQEQIFFKDIPALRQALDVPFTATYMKGRANYLCLHRLDQLNDGGLPAMHDVFLPIIREWSGRTETGDRAELEDLPEDLPFWNEVSATAETCLGTECPRYDDCFVTRMRQRAAASDVVIVNHHLLCADAAVQEERVRRSDPRLQSSRSSTRRTSSKTSRRSTSASRSATTGSRTTHATSNVSSQSGALDHRPGVRPTSRRGSTDCATTRARSSASWRSRIGPASGCAARSGCAPPTRRCSTRAKRLPTSPGRSTSSKRRWCCRSGNARTATDRAAARPGCRRARADAPVRFATTCAFCCASATRRTSTSWSSAERVSFLRASPIDVSAIVQGAALRSDANDRADVGDADRRRAASTTSVSGWESIEPTKCGCASEFDFARAGDAVSAAANAGSALAGVRHGRRTPGGRDPEAIARTRVRAVHQLCDAAIGPGDRGNGARLSDSGAGHGASHRSCSGSSGPRRTACCLRRRASGRASTWWATP